MVLRKVLISGSPIRCEPKPQEYEYKWVDGWYGLHKKIENRPLKEYSTSETRMSIAFVSRLFYHEACNIYYGENQFNIGRDHSRGLWDFTEAVGDINSALVRSIIIESRQFDIGIPVRKFPNIIEIVLLVDPSKIVGVVSDGYADNNFYGFARDTCEHLARLKSFTMPSQLFIAPRDRRWTRKSRNNLKELEKFMAGVNAYLAARSPGQQIDYGLMCLVDEEGQEVAVGHDGVIGDDASGSGVDTDSDDSVDSGMDTDSDDAVDSGMDVASDDAVDSGVDTDSDDVVDSSVDTDDDEYIDKGDESDNDESG